jgi:hypothetical protein
MGMKGMIFLMTIGVIIYSVYQIRHNNPLSQENADRKKMERLQEKGSYY